MADEVVVLTGIDETISALKQFDKDAVRRFNKVINDALRGAESDARNIVQNIGDSPMSGWRKYDAARPRVRGGAGWPAWNMQTVIGGIRKTKAQGKVRGDFTTSAGALINKSAAGAIFEVAGRKTKSTGARTASGQFLRNLGNRFGKASRLIWRVVDKDRVKIETDVKRALDDAKAELQKHLNRERV